ncbi:hypothetical protein [Streptomyces incarnatus]|nr:hypothetical protein [Streptomyces incarnatus]
MRAWALTVDRARAMGAGPGTMGMALPLFLLLWVTMLIPLAGLYQLGPLT